MIGKSKKTLAAIGAANIISHPQNILLLTLLRLSVAETVTIGVRWVLCVMVIVCEP